ncbi:MAG: Clp protease N-terminal domain-containing protein, partial [bacterium]|nr:Clp protease N-terminal domain-containing protein [bacterium]
MLCQQCNAVEATVHFTQISGGEVSELWLCERCAREKGIVGESGDIAFNPFGRGEFSLEELFSMFFPRGGRAVDRYSDRSRKSLEQAREEARRLKNNYLGTEHMLLGIVRDPDNLATKALVSMGVDVEHLRKEIETVVSGSVRSIAQGGLTPDAKHALDMALDESRRMGHGYIGPEHLLLGLLREKQSTAAKLLAQQGVDLKKTRQHLAKLMAPAETAQKQRQTATPALDTYGRDLTMLAEEGKLDPVIGREEEIGRVIQVLSRRTKNNPVLIGEAGVGKTAI